ARPPDQGAGADPAARGRQRRGGARGDRLGTRARAGDPRHRAAERARAGSAAGAARAMSDAFIYEAVRTPFGRFGGALAGVRPDDLAAQALKALLARVEDLDPAAIDDILLGDANGAGED